MVANDQQTAACGLQTDMAVVRVHHDKTGAGVSMATSKESGSVISISESKEKDAWTFAVTPDGTRAGVLVDEDGKTRLLLGVDKKKTCSLGVLDKNGINRLHVGGNESVGFGFLACDAEGEPVWTSPAHK